MKTQTIIQDYYGASSFIQENNHKELVIFIVDDNKIYRRLMKRTINRPNFSVLTFSTGEECLKYMHLNPDLVLLDYHLDGVNPYAKKGDVIYPLIKEKSPDTKIIMISSDEKFRLISDLNLKQKSNLVFKDDKVYRKIKNNVLSFVTEKEKKKSFHNFKNISIIIISIAFIIIYTLLFLI